MQETEENKFEVWKDSR